MQKCGRVSVSNLLRFAGACGVVFVTLVAIFIVLEALAVGFIDDTRILRSLQDSVKRQVLLQDADPIYPYGRPHKLYTECILLGMNLGNSDESLRYRIAASPHLGEFMAGRPQPCFILVNTISTGRARSEVPYLRYWHGHQVYLRPLLSIMPLDHVRILNALLLIGALVFLCVRLASWFGIWAAPAFMLPLLLGSDLLIIPLSTNQTLSLIWIFFSVGLVASAIERLGIGGRTLVVVFALGAIANYFDLLINPPLAPALIAFLVMWRSLQERQDGPRRWRAAVSFGACVTAWFSGYSLAWGAKWLLAAAILGVQTAAPDIANQIWLRTYGGSAPGASLGIFTSTFYQFKEVGLPLFAACWGVAGALIVNGAVLGRVKRGELADFAVLQLPLVIPVIWVMILRDHSIMHANFVSRSFVLYAALPLLSAFGVLSDRQPHDTVTRLA